MRKYRGEWQTAFLLLQDWGSWHWVNRDRMPLGYPSITNFWAAAHGSSGGHDFDIPAMSEDQQLCEMIVRHCLPDHQQRLAKLLFCDYPTDGIVFIAKKINVRQPQLSVDQDTLLAAVSSALMLHMHRLIAA